ncbi:MAG: hypothetical protein HYV29_04350 [Ignavibacteriales bacterium]|nr:hypothetical protein [Ignavibacteriales bacterium]
MKRTIIIGIYLLLFPQLHAQDTTGASAQETIESILNNVADEQDLQQFGEELEYLQQHPIYIVKPNYNDLVKLPFVSPMLAEAIVLFTDTVEIISLDQLLDLPLMTDETHAKLIPFITLDQPGSQSNFSLFALQNMESRTRVERRLQESQGYRDNTFRGDITSTYQRMRLSNGNIELAGLFEKDAGEIYDDGLIAGYISIKNISLIRHAVVGNFNISSGQGLMFAKNIATAKGSNAVSQTRKRGSIISPSVSTDEYRYFQGVVGSALFSNLSIAGFYSKRDIPASVDASGTVTSFYTSGIYRTANDLKWKHGVDERMLGAHLNYAVDPLKSFSVTLMNVEYSKAISTSLFDLRKRKSISAGSLSWELPFPVVNFFGEIASNEGDRFSKIFGAIVPLSPRVAVSYHHRTFTKGFTSPFARPFGERDIISDGEVGNYFGAEFKLPDLTINTYVDTYLLPSTTNTFDTHGTETFVHGAYSFNEHVDVTLQVRSKTRRQTFVRAFDDQRVQTNYRFAYKAQITRQVALVQRFEVVNISYDPSNYKEKGFLTFIEGILKWKDIAADLKSRVVFFDTDSYDSRLYQYESDVAGNFSNPPLYGNGIRWYLILGYEIFNKFRLSMKYSETKKLHEHVLGSGDDEILGNVDNYIALQLDFEM